MEKDWDAWRGREETRRERVDESLLARWLATFDREAPANGAAPDGFHWCLCTPDAQTGALGADGHPQRTEAGFLPPLPFPRRMWAASAIAFHAPIRAGENVTRISRVASITPKQGASGDMVFVEVAHETSAGDRLAVRETQTIVYRGAAPNAAPLAPPPLSAARFDASAWQNCRTLTPGPPLLFRYSALTFNAHRIHYDAPYAMDEERYRGLVVHGPLTATLLLDLARRQLGDHALAHFAFRGVSPAIANEPLHLAMRQAGARIELSAFAEDGRQVMSASATPRP